ncbi:EAL domain-containing protein [Methylotenera versatilis]|uniref:Diguanylate cyclase/phosphodiesterase with extracellular sensor n=1 Tax=Methylotenera versatilis (strain 301) TaxID=666681 RepID=D7DMU7_METV0|nr:EAL domain-containing protein [Methylotenera versatilis]ADI30874.1 diguanylate cyclase/phosphodiesterase with extracellular sensor [Methylotenera versatilis 301]
MKNLGIKSRVIFLGTIPALLFAIILVGYAITNIFGVLDQSLEDRGRVIASQLAPAAEYGVISGNSQVLQRLVQQALSNEQDLRTVMVVDSHGLTLALSGRELPKALIAEIAKENLEQIPQDKGIIFTFPIYRSLVEIDDFSNLSSKELELKKSYTPEKIGQVYIELSNQTLQNIKQDLIVKIFLTAIFGLALSGLLAWKLGRNITKPIQEIAQAVNRIGEGVFSHTIMENSSGELKTLQKGFNSMSSSLKHAYDGMQEKINDATSMLRHQAQHDDLTGLINRREFEVRLERCLKSVHENNAQHIFCFLDLDQFKLVNDTCGHSAGDELLKQVSILLANKMRERDTLARLGGDEFGLLLENCTLTDANQINNALLKTIRDYRFIHDDKIFNIGVSIGLVVINQGFENVSEIIHAADLACYSAKSAGRNQSFLFNPGDVEVVRQRSAVESISDITDEIDDEQFMLYCQPIVPLTSATTQLQHYEILLRKIDLDGKIILPTTFIPSAERYHLMPNIDRWVIKNVFLAYQKLLEINAEKCNYIFSINLSGTSLGDKSLLSFIQDMFIKYSIPPQSICFEITETAAIVNLKNTILLFSALRKLGCSFALDDFGSGMSSFTYLKNFDVDYLKIDGTFVKEMHINKIDHAMVRSIHSVAEAMSIKTVAEFVENEEILSELKSIGVHYGQGLYLGAPVTVKGLIERYAKLHAQ